MTPADKARRVRLTLIWGTALSLVFGAASGGVGVYFGAPFYAGFFSGFVLAGLVAMFVLAVHLVPPGG